MFTVESFPTANMWKQRVFINVSMDKDAEYYSAIKNEVLPFSTTQMNLEAVMLCSERHKDSYQI